MLEFYGEGATAVMLTPTEDGTMERTIYRQDRNTFFIKGEELSVPDGTVKLSDTKTVATYFKGDPKFGPTTTLANRYTGETLGVYMGACSRKEAYAAWLKEQEKRDDAGT